VIVLKSRVGGKTASAFILMLFFSSLLALTLITLTKAENTEPMIWIVDDDDPAADYSSIQAAIDAAEFGDIVYVRNGNYYEHVLINKTLTLLGEDKTSVVIDGNFTGDVVTISANDIEICGFTIQNSGKRIVTGGWQFPVVYESMCGVYINGYTGCNISGNVVSNNFVGLCFEDCSNISISENQIVNNYGDSGIFIGSSSSVTLSKNNITLNKISGVVMIDCLASTVLENQIVENPGQGGMVISRSCFFTVCKNNITGNAFHGLNLVNADKNRVFGNNMSSNHYGICLSGSDSNEIYENYMQANYYGARFCNSLKNQFYNNELVDNTIDVYNIIRYRTGTISGTGSSSVLSSSSPTPSPAPRLEPEPELEQAVPTVPPRLAAQESALSPEPEQSEPTSSYLPSPQDSLSSQESEQTAGFPILTSTTLLTSAAVVFFGLVAYFVKRNRRRSK
jgi:parallel beta-helix repeat protein